MLGKVFATQSKLLEQQNLNAKMTEVVVGGRADDEFRKIFLKTRVLEGVCGSAYVELGDTKVICSVNGPKESNSDSEEGSINVIVSGIDQCARLPIQCALNSIVCLKKIARAEVDVELNVLADDGGALAVALMAASLALTSANVECFDVLLASHFLVREDGGFVVDPDVRRVAAERCRSTVLAKTDGETEEASSSRMDAPPAGGSQNALSITLAIAPSLGQVVFVDASGSSISRPKLTEAIRYGFAKCMEIYTVFSKSLHNHASKLL